MNFYISIFEDSKIISIKRYGANELGKEGTVNEATFSIKGQEFMCFDSYIKHQFKFTPSFSLSSRSSTTLIALDSILLTLSNELPLSN